MNAETGLCSTAYHPAGHYGLLQVSAEQLSAAGGTGSPDRYLTAGVAQLPVIRDHLTGRAVPQDASDVALWICLLLPENERPALSDDAALATVLATPTGPRPELWSTHGVADVDGDGRLTVGDLQRYLQRSRDDRSWTNYVLVYTNSPR